MDVKNNLTFVKEQSSIFKPQNPQFSMYEIDEDGLFLFLSIDVCNSTELKYNKDLDWFKIVNRLYNTEFSAMTFWKLNGDEVLYYQRYNSVEFLIQIIEKAHQHIRHLQTEMRRDSGDEPIKLKGTIWIARTSKSGEENCPHNIQIVTNSTYEYVGLNIDEGFRLSHKSSGGKIVIDPKIIFLIKDAYTHAEENNNTLLLESIQHFLEKTYYVGLTQLKGVWNNRGYPVFWYYKTHNEDYEYDEKLDSRFLEEKPQACFRHSLKLPELAKIFNKVSIMDEVNAIRELAKKETYKFPTESLAKLYYSCVCHSPFSEKVLIAKRSEKRKHLKNVWDFGTCKHGTGSTVDTIKKVYMDTFGVEIEVETDKEEECNVLPLHFCTIFRRGVAHNSMLCTATIVNPECVSNDEELIEYIYQKADHEKYEEFRLVSSEDVCDFSSISLDAIEADSIKASENKAPKFVPNSAIMYFDKSIKAVENYYSGKRNNMKWYE